MPAPTPAAMQRLRRLADDVRLLVWMTDAEGTCIFLNQGSLFEPHQWAEFNKTAWAQFVHPDDAVRVRPILLEARALLNDYQVEYRLLKSDGSTRWIMSCGAPRFLPDGAFDGYNGTMVDVSDRHEALERISKSEAELRLITEYSSDLISHYSPRGKFLYVSPSYLRVLGYDATELLGQNAYAFVHPDDVETIRTEAFRQFSELRESAVVEVRKRHKDGHYLWVGIKAQVLLDPTSRGVTGVVAISRDITPERQAKQDMAQREERFRSLTTLSSDWYWETDAEDRFTFVSDGLQRLFGTSPGEVIGKTRRERAADPTAPDVLTYFDKVARREPFRDLAYSAYVESRGSVLHSVICGEPVFVEGSFVGYRGTGRDVTREIEVSSRMLQLSEENNAIVEHSLDLMVILDSNGRYVRVNGAVREILGYEPEELLGRHYSELLVQEDLEMRRSMETTLRDGAGTGSSSLADLENRWRRKDGKLVYLSSSIRWSHSRQIMYATGRDVTDRRRVQSELQLSKDNLARVLESISDAFYAIDRDWRATYVNQKTAALLGRDQSDLVGRTVFEVIPDFANWSAYPHFRQAMDSGENQMFVEYYPAIDAWAEVRLYPHADGLSVFVHDITQRRRAEEAIRTSDLRLRNMIDMTPAGYVITDPRGLIVEANPAFCNMTGYRNDELIGLDVLTLMVHCPLDGALFIRGGLASVHGREATVVRKGGALAYVLLNVSIERDAAGDALSLTAFLTDITERKHSEARMEQLATHDALTGLPNRTLINKRVQQMLAAAKPGDQIALMFVDLDRFKEVNDSLGHVSGDALLQDVARRLQSVMRPQDVIARLGGDEFIAASYCGTGTQSAALIAERLLEALSAPFTIAGQEVYVSASIGISVYPDDGVTNEALLQNADIAMYRAKAAGRNGYCFFEARMSTEAKTRMSIEHALHRALERREFVLHYQPRINLRTMQITGMEALIRWNHPQLGMVPPLSFIPIAEERGFIDAIGKWVLEEACTQCARLNLQYGLPLHVSVNVAARQLKSSDFVQQVLHALALAGLAPGALELELTESALIENVDVCATLLGQLRAMGIRVSVDDFGTGFSGLSYLRRFPLDILKLDRSFLSHESAGVRSDAFIKAFVDMAHTLNLSVVAEGVEDQETCAFLRNCACDEAQGYLFARPLTLAAFESYLAEASGPWPAPPPAS